MSVALKIDIEVLQSDILDFIDENESYTDASSVDDVIAKLIDLRTSLYQKSSNIEKLCMKMKKWTR